MRKVWTALISCSALSGCAASSPQGIDAGRIPPSLAEACPALTRPEGDLTAEAVWTAWNRDRWAAEICRSRHAGLVAALEG